MPTFIRPAKVVVSDDGLDATAILAALAALALAAAAVWFVLANAVLIAALLAVFAVGAAAIVFVAWKYGPQLANFRCYRITPRRTQAVTARVVRPLPVRQAAAIEAPITTHPASVIREAVPQPRSAK
jgi:hypothetical protein